MLNHSFYVVSKRYGFNYKIYMVTKKPLAWECDNFIVVKICSRFPPTITIMTSAYIEQAEKYTVFFNY